MWYVYMQHMNFRLCIKETRLIYLWFHNLQGLLQLVLELVSLLSFLELSEHTRSINLSKSSFIDYKSNNFHYSLIEEKGMQLLFIYKYGHKFTYVQVTSRFHALDLQNFTYVCCTERFFRCAYNVECSIIWLVYTSARRMSFFLSRNKQGPYS